MQTRAQTRAQTREQKIRNFVETDLNPNTRNELFSLVCMFRKDASLSENELIIKYILDSNDDFFSMYRMKNNMERTAIEADERIVAGKAAAKAVWVDEEARAYIRHQLHSILDKSIASETASPALIKLAAEVKARAEEIVGSAGYVRESIPGWGGEEDVENC